MTEASDSADGANWMQQFLESAVRDRLCTSVMCTTCGAREFRSGLIRRAMKRIGQLGEPKLDSTVALEIARGLARLRLDDLTGSPFEEAVRLIHCDLHAALHFDLAAKSEVERLLSGTWAGSVEARMQSHEAARRVEREARGAYESPESVRARREEKLRRKEVEQQVRRARKQERDRLWRESNKGGP